MIAIILNATSELINALDYTIGGIIALLILGYLIYSLVKPEKF